MIRIIGGGFSGLSLAYHFVKKGASVTIVEKNRIGGVIESRFQCDMLVESAANGLLASQKIEELFQDIGIKPLQTRPESRKKFIFRGRMRRWPLTFSESISFVFKIAKSIITNQFQPKPSETLKEWADRTVGNTAAEYLVQPMVNGIFAQSIDKLNAYMVLSSMRYKRSPGHLRGLISAAGGMGEVISKLNSYLLNRGVKFEFQNESEIDLENMQHNTFLAIDLFSFQKLVLKQKTYGAGNNTKALNSLSLVRATINFKGEVHEIDGFGVLFANLEKFNALGVLANTKIFSGRGAYNESWIFSDSTALDLMNWTDQDILHKITVDRKRMFKVDFEIKNIVIHRWPQVIPDYSLDLKQFLSENPSLAKKLSGNYLGVLGLTGIHERNETLAEQFLNKKGGT